MGLSLRGKWLRMEDYGKVWKSSHKVENKMRSEPQQTTTRRNMATARRAKVAAKTQAPTRVVHDKSNAYQADFSAI